MRKIYIFMIAVLLMSLIVFAENEQIRSVSPAKHHPSALKEQQWILFQSKARIVTAINQNVTEIHELEKAYGKKGSQGYKIYSAAESEQLIHRYQLLALLLHYLNQGNLNLEKNQWEGYPFSLHDNLPYERKKVFAAMSDLARNNFPQTFVTGLRIYILPYAIPNVSGLGGPGYILLSAQNTKETLIDNQLPVTLDHEIGHHVNFTFMSKENSRGAKLWKKFLQIRGGVWHGPGVVNTKAWGSSSEETFAEDFRMLFGKNQPYFGDLALGDPRSNLSQANRERKFLMGLKNEKPEMAYHSPWIAEEGLLFWQNQGILLLGSWLLLGLAIAIVRGLSWTGRGLVIGKKAVSTDSF